MERKASPNKPDQMGLVQIRVAHTAADSAVIADIFDRVWDVKSMVSSEIITASLHNGGYGSVVYIGDHAVGATFALFARALAGCSGPNLHSHATGVLPGLVGRGIGAMVKRHQWDWAKENGFETITWTFDPLVRRNAHFNLVKLGATVTGYYQNFYGELNDGINAGEQSDRLLVRWTVAGVDAPRANDFVQPATASVVIETPTDIEQLRKTDRVLSNGWRTLQRAAFEAAQRDGLRVVGLSQDFSYVLNNEKGTDGA